MKEYSELEESTKREYLFLNQTLFFCVAGSAGSPRSLGLFRRVRIEKALKSNKSASQAVQNVSRRKEITHYSRTS